MPPSNFTGDGYNYYNVANFGAAHPAGCQFVMCDGSVQTVPYAIDELVHWELANRSDVMQRACITGRR